MDQLSRTSLFSEISDLSVAGVDDVDEPYKKIDAVPSKLVSFSALFHAASALSHGHYSQSSSPKTCGAYADKKCAFLISVAESPLLLLSITILTT